jgi:Spy/CpxP family protein refolding chaperone
VKKSLLILSLLLAVAAPIQAQQGQARREELEVEIAQRFLDRAATELKLDAGARTRLEQHLRQSATPRRSLAQNTVRLRGQLLRAVRDENTTDAEFNRLINEMTQLRDQEETMWKADQEALSRILTPRQHARFIVLWIRFNDQVREMAMKRGGGNMGPGGPGRSGFQQPIRRP